MPLPTEELIIWANTDVNLPELAGPNKTKPIDDLINKGWDFTEKPAADEFNYVLNNLGMHVSYLEESKTYTFSGDVTGTATSTGSDDVTFNVSVTDNSHNHISANISDATSLNTPNMVVRRDDSGNFSAGTVTASLSGNSSTATTLQTARTINGTSFNGSTNITTNSWGTARTFALTSAVTGSVSVDGSGNISLATTYTGFTKSVGVTGYQQLPSGMVEMWTTVVIPTATPATWTYPQTLSSVVSAVITPITGVTGEFYYITAGLSSAVIDNIPGNSAFTAYVVVKGYL